MYFFNWSAVAEPLDWNQKVVNRPGISCFTLLQYHHVCCGPDKRSKLSHFPRFHDIDYTGGWCIYHTVLQFKGILASQSSNWEFLRHVWNNRALSMWNILPCEACTYHDRLTFGKAAKPLFQQDFKRLFIWQLVYSMLMQLAILKALFLDCFKVDILLVILSSILNCFKLWKLSWLDMVIYFLSNK